MKTKKETTTRGQALCELYNTLSNDDLLDLINMATDRIFIFNPYDNKCYNVEGVCKFKRINIYL